jgi:hypothetical protein
MAERRTVKDLGQELMIYEPDADRIHFLNPTARRIYQLHLEGKMAGSIGAILREEFSVPEERDLAEDIHAFLRELASKGLQGGAGAAADPVGNDAANSA